MRLIILTTFVNIHLIIRIPYYFSEYCTQNNRLTMKKLLLILLCLPMIGFASFPVLENEKKESVEYSKMAVFTDSDDTIHYVLGFMVGCLSFMLFFLPLLFLFSKNKAFRKGIYIGLGVLLVILLVLLSDFADTGFGLTIM